jgi:hypothetical protein
MCSFYFSGTKHTLLPKYNAASVDKKQDIVLDDSRGLHANFPGSQEGKENHLQVQFVRRKKAHGTLSPTSARSLDFGGRSYQSV